MFTWLSGDKLRELLQQLGSYDTTATGQAKWVQL
jgi:hypothetical protein